MTTMKLKDGMDWCLFWR